MDQGHSSKKAESWADQAHSRNAIDNYSHQRQDKPWSELRMQDTKIIEAPFEWLLDEPEERKYWTTGVKVKPGIAHRFTSGAVSFNDSERAAWIDRGRCLASGIYDPNGDPRQITRDEINEICRATGKTLVTIFGAEGEVVEEWQV